MPTSGIEPLRVTRVGVRYGLAYSFPLGAR